MDITIPEREDLERSIHLMLEARRGPSLKRWMALAEYYYDLTFGDREDMEDDEEDGDFGLEILQALVELSWWGWKRDPERFAAALRIGQSGDDENGTPPFLNMRMGFAHFELAIMFDQVGDLALSDDARVLGLLLLAFHTAEAFIRPGMVMMTFLLRILTGEEPTIETVLRDKAGKGKIRSYSDVRDGLMKAIRDAKAVVSSSGYLKVLDRFMTEGRNPLSDTPGVDLDLRAVRDAIAHHDFDIFEGQVRLRWVYHSRGGRPGQKDIMKVDELEENLDNLQGLVATMFAWENMLMAVCLPEDIPEDAKAAIIAKELIESLETLKRVAWPFIR